MYCSNCGHKVTEDAYVCLKCGVILKKRVTPDNKVSDSNGLGIVSLVMGVISFISSCSLFFNDISSVGMYIKIYERIIYGFGYVSLSIMIAFVSLIFALINRKNKFNKIGLGLTIISLFLIISEIIVIVIY